MLDEIEVAAIQSFTLSVTVPILLDLPNGAVQLLATGTLFRVGGRHLIVTARHVFDNVNAETMAFPAAPKGGDAYTLGKFTIFKPEEEHVDVAVMRLESPDVIEMLSKSWHFLSLENIARPFENAPDETFFVAGYPDVMTKMVGAKLHGNFVTAYSQRLPDIPKWATEPVVPELDLFFDYGEKAKRVGGGEIDSPALPGVSGASIWQIGSVDGIWTPESAIRVVGVQSAYKPSEYFRAKSWWAVAKILEQIDETLAIAVREQLTL